MGPFEDGDEVELMSSLDLGKLVKPILRETHGTVRGPRHGMGNFAGTGVALVSFPDRGAYTVPEKWLTIIKKAEKKSGARE